MNASVEMKIIQAPCPPTIPTAKSRMVFTVSDLALFEFNNIAARRCAPVIKSPPIIMVFLAPY